MTALARWITGLGILALLALTVLPAQASPWVYRISRDQPSQVFANGFTSAGPQINLLDHIFGGGCTAAEPAQRTAWTSSTSLRERARQFADWQLDSQPNLQSLWIYAIRTDDSYLDVPNVLQQAMRAAEYSQNGYTPTHGTYLRRLLTSPQFNRQGEVVTRRIAPGNIYSARLIGRSPDGESIIEAPTTVPNAGYREPATDMTNAVADLQVLVPGASLLAYANHQSSDTCEMECDGASASRVQRERRSVAQGGPICARGPSAGQLFIGSEEL
jgi:hypothetical protein